MQILGIMTVVMSFEIDPTPTFSPGWYVSLSFEAPIDLITSILLIGSLMWKMALKTERWWNSD